MVSFYKYQMMQLEMPEFKDEKATYVVTQMMDDTYELGCCIKRTTGDHFTKYTSDGDDKREQIIARILAGHKVIGECKQAGRVLSAKEGCDLFVPIYVSLFNTFSNGSFRSFCPFRIASNLPISNRESTRMTLSSTPLFENVNVKLYDADVKSSAGLLLSKASINKMKASSSARQVSAAVRAAPFCCHPLLLSVRVHTGCSAKSGKSSFFETFCVTLPHGVRSRSCSLTPARWGPMPRRSASRCSRSSASGSRGLRSTTPSSATFSRTD